jgi:ketosteroid isomerase-like protein
MLRALSMPRGGCEILRGTMSEENVEVVRRAVELVRRRDEQSSGSRVGTGLLDDALEVHDHDSPDLGVLKGHAGFLRWIDDWDEAWAEWRLEPEEFIDAGERVVVLVRLSARGRGSGVSLERRDGMVWTVRNGMAIRLDYYNSPAEALEAAGLRE